MGNDGGEKKRCFPGRRTATLPQSRHKNKANERGQRGCKFAHDQYKAEREYEAEDRHFRIIARAGGVPPIEEFDQRREKCGQQEH